MQVGRYTYMQYQKISGLQFGFNLISSPNSLLPFKNLDKSLLALGIKCVNTPGELLKNINY